MVWMGKLGLRGLLRWGRIGQRPLMVVILKVSAWLLWLGFWVTVPDVGRVWAQTPVQMPVQTPAQTPSPAPVKTVPPQSMQPYFDRVMRSTTEFQLDNGLKFIVLERHQAPVVSFLTYADVGGVDEGAGKTGEAHFLEHLAFKGTSRIGTRDYPQEVKLQAQFDALRPQLRLAEADRAQLATRYNEQHPQMLAATAKVQALTASITRTSAELQQVINQNEYGRIVQQSGGVGLNATTTTDATEYFYSFPANKLELWMSLESERFLDPVFREFDQEKAVIFEERRMRVDSSPIGQLLEAFSAKAFSQHPYRRPVIGYPEDLAGLTRSDVEQFFQTHYVPSKLTLAIVGDVDPQVVKRLAQTYFGRFPKRAASPATIPVEPAQTATQEVTLKLQSQPVYVEGYHRPAFNHPDEVVYGAMASILSDGRTSRLYKSLVEEQKLALTAQGMNGFPGDKYPSLMLFYALSAPGHDLDQVAKALEAELDRLKTEPVAAAELDRVKTQARSGLLRSLDSNSGMASALLEYEVKTGSWRNLFRELEAINRVTPADIQRVAQATFTPQNRTVGRILPP
jgi:predicted Zn-dependent peptidase